MFHRCINDKTGLEPRGLFQIVEFMMHDVDSGGTISQDEFMEILFSRFGKDQLLEKTKEFFPQTAADGGQGEQTITFVEFRTFMQAIKPKRKTNRERALAVLKPAS
jgi:calmodulin